MQRVRLARAHDRWHFASMWEKPAQLTATGVARPIRVAYLVDVDDCPTRLLDAIVAECYGRWGGRRTLVVPTTADGVDPRFSEWLLFFDADVVYSFVALTEVAIAGFHERYAPAYLVKHYDRGRAGDPAYNISLPLSGLSSLSVVPTFARHTRDFQGPRDVMLLDKYWDRSASPFLQENFGFLWSTFSSSAVASTHPDVFSCMTLITKAALDDRQMLKDRRTHYATSESEVFSALSNPEGPVTLSQLAEFYTPYLSTGEGVGTDGTTLVAGDSVSDRLLFWNMHHRYRRGDLSHITVLRLPTDRLDDDAFIRWVRKILERRGVYGPDGHNDRVVLCSASLDDGQLASLAERLRNVGKWVEVHVKRFADHAAIVPTFSDPNRVWFYGGGAFSEPTSKATSEYVGKRFAVPMAVPWHLREASPPATLREGNWMVDVTAERHTDHCRYVNGRHTWLLPRRLRLEQMFTVEREGDTNRDSENGFIRPMRSGAIGLALSMSVTRAVLTAPEDLEAFQGALCNEFEWMPFERFEAEGPRAQKRFSGASLYDKGRYLHGVLALFETAPDAFKVLMDGYWRDMLRQLGGVPAEKSEEAKTRLLQTLRRRLRQPTRALTFDTEPQYDILCREALRAGRAIAREERHTGYDKLKKKWEELVRQFVEQNPRPEGQSDDGDVHDVRLLNQSIQHLCARKLLFQGREWRCQTCNNRNWVSLDAMQRSLTCSVCRHNEPAPVAGEWHFRANPFVIEACREHGCEAVLWALWQLSERAFRSFYFAPSMRCWLKSPESGEDQTIVEIDAVVVVDGLVYAVEAKSSPRTDESEIRKLVLVAEHIRPDILLVANMGVENSRWRDAMDDLKARLPLGTALETLHFSEADLDRVPWLPA